MSVLPNTIDEVLDTLDTIIQETVDDGNYLGIFAYVYRRTTAQIKQAIQDEIFEDNPGMERFDVLFANLYIKAYFDFKAGNKTTGPWQLSFDAKDEPLIIMQHLILGMNSHINMDLGLAAATFAPGEQIHDFKNDFMKVNKTLQDLTHEMKLRVAKVSRLMFLIDWIGDGKDEVLAGFSIEKARDFAWTLAKTVALLPDESSKEIAISEADHLITSVGKIVHQPPGRLAKWILKFVKMFEEKNVKVIIDKLSE